MQEIIAWLDGDRDYWSGSALYEKYGSNSFLKKVLPEGPTPYKIQKLETELESLVPATPAKHSASTIDAPQNDIVATPDHSVKSDQDSPAPNPKEMERYLSLKLLLKQTYDQIQRNMVLLDLLTDQKQLHQSAKHILNLNDKVTGIYDLLDFYDEHGKFPEIGIEKAVIKTPKKELDDLMIVRSKAKTRLKSPKCRNRVQTQKLIDDTDIRIAELRKELKSCQ
jgi:hypothetical protein